MDWVAEFYRKQYEWADWRNRWADFDPTHPDPHVAAVDRLAGAGSKRSSELGAGVGSAAAALAHAGHDVVAIELQPMLAEHIAELAENVRVGSLRAITGDFYEVDPGSPFDVVAYFDGFGIGTDDDQRRLLDRIVAWLTPEGFALIDVLPPWYWAGVAGSEEEYPEGSGVRYRDSFDAEGSRMVEEMWRVDHDEDLVTRSLRCSSPADLRLLLEATGPTLSAIEPYEDQWYGQPCSLDVAMLHLAQPSRR